MPTAQARVGYTDLLDMPDDGRRYEIHGGELVVVPSPLPRHQMVVQRVFLLLHEHGLETGGLALIAPLDIVLDEFDVVQPDVVFFRAERRHLVRPDAVTRHPPDIAVEVPRSGRRRRLDTTRPAGSRSRRRPGGRRNPVARPTELVHRRLARYMLQIPLRTP